MLRRALLAFAILAPLVAAAPAIARDNPHDHSSKVAHNQAKAQQKAMKKAAKQQRKELEKTRKRAPQS